MTSEGRAKAAQEALSRTGKTHADVARELGVARAVVRGVLYGHLKGTRGDAHKVAVALGLKAGIVVPEGMPIAEALRRAAA